MSILLLSKNKQEIKPILKNNTKRKIFFPKHSVIGPILLYIIDLWDFINSLLYGRKSRLREIKQLIQVLQVVALYANNQTWMSLALCSGSESPSPVHTSVLTTQILVSHLGRNGDPQSILKCSASSFIISLDQLSIPGRTIFSLTLLFALPLPVLCLFRLPPMTFSSPPLCWFTPWYSSDLQHNQLCVSCPELQGQWPLCWMPHVIADVQFAPHHGLFHFCEM